MCLCHVDDSRVGLILRGHGTLQKRVIFLDAQLLCIRLDDPPVGDHWLFVGLWRGHWRFCRMTELSVSQWSRDGSQNVED